MKGFLLFQIMLYNMWEFPTILQFYVAHVGYEVSISYAVKYLNLNECFILLAKCMFAKHIEHIELQKNVH